MDLLHTAETLMVSITTQNVHSTPQPPESRSSAAPTAVPAQTKKPRKRAAVSANAMVFSKTKSGHSTTTQI